MEVKQRPTQPAPTDTYYHIVRDNRLLRGMFVTERRASKAAADYPDAIIVAAAERAQLREMGFIIPAPGEQQ